MPNVRQSKIGMSKLKTNLIAASKTKIHKLRIT